MNVFESMVSLKKFCFKNTRSYLVSSARVVYKGRPERIFVISLEAFERTVALKFFNSTFRIAVKLVAFLLQCFYWH